MATAQGVPITLALVVAAPLCWGVIAAKPPRLALLQLSEMRPVAPHHETFPLQSAYSRVKQKGSNMPETTLILLKPDCVSKKLVGEVIGRLEKAGYSIRGAKALQLEPEILREHYAHIADKPFFPDVEKFMSSGPVLALAIRGENVISGVRDLLGPTDSTKAAKGTIRGDFGVDMMVNVVHASDSLESAQAELKRFFSDGGLLD